MKQKFGHYFAADAGLWSVVMKFNLGRYYEARFGQDFNFRFSRDADVWLRF